MKDIAHDALTIKQGVSFLNIRYFSLAETHEDFFALKGFSILSKCIRHTRHARISYTIADILDCLRSHNKKIRDPLHCDAVLDIILFFMDSHHTDQNGWGVALLYEL